MTTIADRFEIEAVAGEGGMGTVYRARDVASSAPSTVALKVVRGPFANPRFEREATLLSQIEGEGIVRYVAHGRIDAQSMFLAMEWLEGEPLDVRLTRGPLAIGDCISLGRRLARALGIAHAHGVVHRDVKPSNVILRGGHAAEATLVDFGIARAQGATLLAMTAAGAVIGTPQYMAPEQARGEDLDGRADVFSLGCLLFECLCGRAAFVGAHVVAVLAKILLDPAGRVSALRPDAPAVLDDLVASMLEKSPDARPPDGAAVAAALDAIHAGDAPADRGTWSPAIGAAERRLATVILARAGADIAPRAPVAGTDEALHGLTGEMRIADLAAAVGVTVTALANGTLVGAVVAEAGATDAAERAVRCALALRADLGDATIALATGRAVVASQLPVGEAIDAAAILLEQHAGAGGIWIDDATASMIDGRFALDRGGTGVSVTGERAVERVRTVMGREVACVGRTRELTLLESTLRECVDEPIARSLVVIAPPGIGKTRLRRELTARVATWESPPAVWLGLADPVTQGASYAFAGDLLRRVLDLPPGDAKARRASLLSRVAKSAPSKGFDAAFVARFLGEIVGVPSEDEDDALRAARRNPELMRARIVDAACAFVDAELERGPILLVVEDVHWADVASVRLLGGVLGRLKERPLMILALARPSVDEVHPHLWEEHRASRFVLEPLLPKAAEKLARAVLGDAADIDAIVKRAEGNPLFVEELARVCAEGGAVGDLPPTIAAAAEARLSVLSAEARHVLRAAAIFGERFWPGAVAHLVGPLLASRIRSHLDALEELEVVSAEPSSRFATEREYVFRHALVRDAAYAMLTDDDRVIGHGLAAEWLEPRANDAAALAGHFELGGRRADAARWHVVAAEDALAALDAAGIVKHVAAAEGCAASGELLGRARLAQADISLWKHENLAAGRGARDAMSLVERGSERWFNAAAIAAAAFGKLEDTAETLSVVDELERTPAKGPREGRARAVARVRAAIQLAYFGELARTDTLLEGCEREPGAAGDAGVLAWLCDAAFDRALASGEPAHPSRFVEGRELYARLGDRRGVIVQTSNHLLTLAMLGAFHEARAAVPAFERDAAEIGFAIAKLVAPWILALCAMADGDVEPLIRFQRATRRWVAPGRGAAGVGMSLAELLVLRGEVDEAADEVAIALPSAAHAPAYRGVLLAVSSMIKLRRHDLAGALADSAQGMDQATRVVALGSAYTPYLARYEALSAAKREDEAREVLRSGAATLSRRAANLGEYGPVYLKHGWRTADLLRLAREHGVAS